MVSPDSTTEASENSSSSEESEKMVHSQSLARSQARAPVPPASSSDSESDDDSDALTPPPKTHQQREQTKEKKQKKEQPSPPSLTPSALISNKAVATKMPAKRPREEIDGILEPPSTKKKITGHTVQQSDAVPAKEKKKAQKQNVAETVSTPSSPLKSANKAPKVWNFENELAFLKGVLAFTKGGKEFPQNMSHAYDHIRNVMGIHYSNRQFRDKLRRIKGKFWSLKENVRVNNYSFKNKDEAAMYEVCEQLWSGQDEGDDEHRHNVETVGKASMNGKEEKKKKKQVVEAEEDGEKTKDGEDQGEEEEDGQHEPKRNKTMANALVKCNGGDAEQISRELFSQLREERDRMVNEMKNTVLKMLKESHSRTMAMVQDYLLNTRAHEH